MIDGVAVEVHHWLPDDFAPHAPESDCGCGPILHDQLPKRLLYEHIDQDVQLHPDYHTPPESPSER
jgi:hypothetical protein